MTSINERVVEFAVTYSAADCKLQATVFEPEGEENDLPPVIFNSGYTGGVSMYGQLMGKALAARGYTVFTYDVSGFFTNKAVHNSYEKDGVTVTRVSLEDQKAELLAAIYWVKKNLGKMPVITSWAMGGVASLAAVLDLAKRQKEQIPFFIPMNYTRMDNLQKLRKNAKEADEAIRALDGDAPIPPFDTGTEDTKLGYYPLDKATQAYVDEQLGAYTDEGNVDHWPGCTHVSADSYTSSLAFDPEAELSEVKNLPPALIIHGAENTLHKPEESIRLHEAYQGETGPAPLMISGMQHGQQLEVGHSIFKELINHIDGSIRAVANQRSTANAS